jgi:hypothetical protein
MNRKFVFASVASLLALSTARSAIAQSSVVAGSEARQELFVTVYTSGGQQTAFVRELREVDLPAGDLSVSLRDVPETVERETILVRVVDGAPLDVLEQSYNYDLLSPNSIMRAAEGERASLDIAHPHNGELHSVQGRLLTSGDNDAIWQTPDGITFGLDSERIRFAQVPSRLASRPTLNWKAKSQSAGKRKIELSYLITGLQWSADYVASLSRDGRMMDLSAWISLTNETSTSFLNTNLAVAAGTVNRAVKYPIGRVNGYATDSTIALASLEQPVREELGHLHLYKVPGHTDLSPNSLKNVRLLSLSSVPVRRRWTSHFYVDPRDHEGIQSVAATGELEADNNNKSHAGVPLPHGTVRVMVPDSKGNGQLVATSSCVDTPEDEIFRVNMGPVSDVTLRMIPTSYKRQTLSAREGKYTIEVKNHANEAGIVRIDLNPGANVTLTVTGAQVTRPSAASYRIEIPVRPSETKKLQVVANTERLRPSRNAL